jgi:hypothetical protein
MVTLPTFVEDFRRPSVGLATVVRRVLSFPVLLGVILFAACFSLAKDSLLDPDMWWHMAVGQRILTTHSWPWTDIYSGTVSGAHWIAYEWLGEVMIGAASLVAGLQGSAFLLVALCGILILLLYCYATLACGDSKAAFVACATLIPAFGAFFALRPQLFGAVFLVMTLIVVEQFRRGRERALWLLPPLFLLWVNTHGSFVFGFLALGVTWLSGQFQFSVGGLFAERWTRQQSTRLLLSILLSALTLPITPYGSRLAAYPLSLALSQPVNVQSIREWLPLGTEMFVGKYFIALLLLFFLACLIERPRFQLSEFALAVFGAFAACVHVRFLLIFLIFFAPLWAKLFACRVPGYMPDRDHPFLNASLIAIVALGMFFFFPSRHELDDRVGTEYPKSALQFVTNHPVRGQWLNDYGWGGYLIWSGAPRNMLFIDGRADIYEYGGVLADYMDVTRLKPDAFKLLNKYNVTACLIRKDDPLATALGQTASWKRVFEDQLAAVYVREQTQTGK